MGLDERLFISPLMHPTALKSETGVSDGGSLELKTHGNAKPAPVVVPESSDNFSDLMQASESTLEFWDYPIDDGGWNDA